MTMFLHNLKVAVRNLMKYKLQTLISIVSIAIGIVTLAFAHSLLNNVRFPMVFNEQYGDRIFKVDFTPLNGSEQRFSKVTDDIIRNLKRDGGLRHAERIAVPNGFIAGMLAEFHLPDSTVKKGEIDVKITDPEYPNFFGLRSAITGEKVRVLKKGEAILSEAYAKKLFGDRNPVGAVQIETGKYQPIPVRIVDVYRPVNLYDEKYSTFGNWELLVCPVEHIEEIDSLEDDVYYCGMIYIALGASSTKQELLDEINQRLLPYGYKANIQAMFEDAETSSIYTIRFIIYLIGSLVLLAGVLGFLRVELQLFRLRHRELSLRIVNGASRIKLFSLLFTEVAIIIVLSMFLALVLGYQLQVYLDTYLLMILNNSAFFIARIWQYCLVIGGGLLVLCSAIAWIAILRTVGSSQGLASKMRTGRNHTFSNVMLTLQMIISIVFVCTTFMSLQIQKEVGNFLNVPENDDYYKECIIFRPGFTEKRHALIDEIRRLPDIDKMVNFSSFYNPLKEVRDNPEIVEKLNNKIYFHTYFTTDTALLSFLGMDVEWFNRDFDRKSCILVSEKRYRQLGELGLLDKNTLSVITHTHRSEGVTLPLGGIIKNIPYDVRGESLVAIHPDWDDEYDFILIPKPGKYKSLIRNIRKVISDIAPEEMNEKIFYYRNHYSPLYVLVEAFAVGGIILGVVSLIICVMTIFSAVTLDTRGRRKEVAIRKVNGAKSRDIYKLFGRVYITIITVALVIAVPLSVLLYKLIVMTIVKITDDQTSMTASPVLPIIIGVFTVIAFVLLIVWWQIRKVMKTDPASVIAKE